MENASSSSLDINGDCIVAGPVQPSPFIPGSPNLFAKFRTQITSDSWELWEFDACNTDVKAATCIGLSLYRDARGLEKGGFHAEVNALWPDGKHWGGTLYFAESIVTEDADGRVHGLWKSKADSGAQEEHGGGKSISFTVSADCSVATVHFSVPGHVEGSLELRSSSTQHPNSRFPETELAAQLCPDVFYMFPMGPVNADADLKIIFPPTEPGTAAEARELGLSTDTGGRGGMVRGWSSKPWATFMNDAYYVVANVGPYMLQILRVLGSVFVQHKPHAVARLYYNNELVCAANLIVETLSNEEGLTTQEDPLEDPQDTVSVTKVVPEADSQEGLAGAFRDKNIGYTIVFSGGSQKKHWEFEVRHKRALWSEPTSAPGEDGTGKSGWIESFSGGSVGEEFQGVGFGGQLQIPVP